MAGLSAASAAPWASAANAIGAAVTIIAAAVRPYAAGAPVTQRATPDPWDSDKYGTPTVVNNARSIFGVGFRQDVFGTPALRSFWARLA